MRIIFLVGLLFAITSCNPFETNQKLKNLNIEVVYGEDNRLDFYQIDHQSEWAFLAQSTVALVDYRDLDHNPDDDSYNLKYEIYGDRYRLCPDEAFYQQPSASFCSGFLIGPDLVVTAGHCLRNQYGCENVRFLFGYLKDSVEKMPTQFNSDQVYSCKELLHSEANAVNGRDFAIARLDREALVTPLPLRSSGTISQQEKLTVIGYPSGIPLKYAAEGEIRKNDSPNFFVTNLDTYGGNSGSAVFNSETLLIEGILVRGETDFVYDQASQCRRSKICQPENCRGEDVVRITLIHEVVSPSDLIPQSSQTDRLPN